MAGKAAAKASDKLHVSRADLRPLAENFARFGVDQVQATPGSNIGQTAQVQGRLHLIPASCTGKRLRDEKPQAPEELLVEDFVTPRGFPIVALDLKPHKIAQHGTGRFIAASADFDKALPKLGITGERGVLHHHARSLASEG